METPHMSIGAWVRRRGWLPPETVGPVVPGQVWTYVPFNLRFGRRQDRYFVTVFRVADGLVWYSMIPGPRYQDVAVLEAEFRQLFRLVPDLIFTAKQT
jgi:hypothetical protein